jgi:hypothetical protein
MYCKVWREDIFSYGDEHVHVAFRPDIVAENRSEHSPSANVMTLAKNRQ